MNEPLAGTDLLVVGAGPGGLAAAIEGARTGARVLVIDDNVRAGGQIYRQLPASFRPTPGLSRQPDFRKGHALLAEAEAAGVTFRFGCTAWGSFEPRILEVTGDEGPSRIRFERLVIAVGAHDRPVPLPGWTLPGVFTVGGAQALLKSQRILPGRRMLLAGVGPLLLVVASQLAEAGVDVVGVAEPVRRRRAFSVLPALAREWPLFRDGLRYRAALVRKRVPWLAGTNVVRVEGENSVSAVWVSKVDARWRPVAGTERRFDVDAVALGYGLIPSIELPRICGCAVRYDAPSRTWIPQRTQQMESTVPGVYLVGDGAGVAGAVVAVEEGRIAGIAAAESLGYLTSTDARRRSEPHERRRHALDRIRVALERAYALEPGLYELAAPSTVVCRCEEVRLSDLKDAFADGADSPALLKSFTRCGMGLCQGRMCSVMTAEWLSAQLDQNPAMTGLPSVAPPAKPLVTLAQLASEG